MMPLIHLHANYVHIPVYNVVVQRLHVQNVPRYLIEIKQPANVTQDIMMKSHNVPVLDLS